MKIIHIGGVKTPGTSSTQGRNELCGCQSGRKFKHCCAHVKQKTINQKASKGLTILANENTNERMVLFINPDQPNLLRYINEKYGGNWCKVNEFCGGDIISFNSEDIYQGYDGREDDNYCQGSLEIKAF